MSDRVWSTRCTLRDKGGDLVIVLGKEPSDTFLSDEPVSVLFVPVSEAEWNAALSPWRADAVFRRAPAFEGLADEWLAAVLPEIRTIRKAYSGRCFVGGYSLAGLCALYLCTMTEEFDGCLSASGSLWYPGFAEYLKEHPVRCAHVYLSIGDREKESKNNVLAQAETKTEECRALLSGYTDVTFERNPGNHFQMEEERLEKGVRWLRSRN